MCTGREGPLAEFTALRQEIDARNKNHHQILSLQLTTAGGIFALVLSKPHLVAVFAIVPFTSFLLCGRFVTQGHAVDRIARYIKADLSRRVPGGLRWEAWHRKRPREDYRWSWLAALLLSFPGAGALAILGSGVYVWVTHYQPFEHRPARLFLYAALALGTLPVVMSAFQLRRLKEVLQRDVAESIDRR